MVVGTYDCRDVRLLRCMIVLCVNVLGGNSLGSIIAIFSLCAEVPSSLFSGSFEKCTVRAVHLSGDRSYDYLLLLLLPSHSDVS